MSDGSAPLMNPMRGTRWCAMSRDQLINGSAAVNRAISARNVRRCRTIAAIMPDLRPLVVLLGIERHEERDDRHRCRRRLRCRRGPGEPLTIGRVLAAALIVAGLSVMKLSTSP